MEAGSFVGMFDNYGEFNMSRMGLWVYLIKSKGYVEERHQESEKESESGEESEKEKGSESGFCYRFIPDWVFLKQGSKYYTLKGVLWIDFLIFVS